MKDITPSNTNLEPDSTVIVKFLDMIERFAGWIVTPRGARKDIQDAVEYYKKSIMKDDSIPDIVKAQRISMATRGIKSYINQSSLIEKTIPLLENNAKPDEVDEDWFNTFFDYAKRISDQDVQQIWAQVLAGKINGSTYIRKNLINVLARMDTETALAFQKLCRISFKIPYFKDQDDYVGVRYLPEYVPFYMEQETYRYVLGGIIREAAKNENDKAREEMTSYKECIPDARSLVAFQELGRIQLKEKDDLPFLYPYADPGEKCHISFKYEDGVSKVKADSDYYITYRDKEYKIVPRLLASDVAVEKMSDKLEQEGNGISDVIEADDGFFVFPRFVRLGNVRFTLLGETLCKAIKAEPVEGLILFLNHYLEWMGLQIVGEDG